MQRTKTTFAAVLVVSAITLTGCTTNPAPEPDASNTLHAGRPASMTTAATPTAGSSQPSPTAVGQAKAAALTVGQPEAAWDKNCVAWELPGTEDDGQAWANELATAWLDALGANCPDAIDFPPDYVYVDSFTKGAPGELIVTLDDQASRNYATPQSYRTGLKNMALETFRGLFAEHRGLGEVTYTVEGEGPTATVDQEAWRKITAHHLWADREFSDALYTEIYGDLPADFSSEQAFEYYEDFFGPTR